MEEPKKIGSKQNSSSAHQHILSAGAQNLLQLARDWDTIEASLEGVTPGDVQAASNLLTPPSPVPAQFLRRVSDPSLDFAFSIEAGFTQSETSTAWCGNEVRATVMTTD